MESCVMTWLEGRNDDIPFLLPTKYCMYTLVVKLVNRKWTRRPPRSQDARSTEEQRAVGQINQCSFVIGWLIVYHLLCALEKCPCTNVNCVRQPWKVKIILKNKMTWNLFENSDIVLWQNLQIVCVCCNELYFYWHLNFFQHLGTKIMSAKHFCHILFI